MRSFRALKKWLVFWPGAKKYTDKTYFRKSLEVKLNLEHNFSLLLIALGN